jgi:uncharacterized protein YcnI
MNRPRLRALALAGLAAGMVVAWAVPASAHVTLHSTDAVQGGSDALIVVRVPNEEDAATTDGVEVDFPLDAPLLNLLVEPTPGWTFQVTQSNLPKPVTTDDGTFTQVVSKVVWSGGSIPVGGFEDFALDVSTLPTVPALEVKAIQTYSNGDVVRWIDDPAPAGQPEPDHPAPTLDLAPPGGSAGASTTTAAPSPSSPTTAVAAAPGVSATGVARTSDVNRAKTLSVVAIVLGVLGLITGAGAVVLFRRRAA